MPEQHYRGVDWKKVVDRLHAYEITLFRVAGYADRQITGRSAGDFTHDALQRLLDPADSGVEWAESRGKPTTDTVFVFLAHVIRNDFIDGKKLPRHTRTEAIVEDRAAPTAIDDVAVDRVDYLRRRQEILDAVSGDDDVAAYLRLQLGEDGYNGYPPRRAAELMNRSPEWINNVKKRCLRFLETSDVALTTKE